MAARWAAKLGVGAANPCCDRGDALGVGLGLGRLSTVAGDERGEQSRPVGVAVGVGRGPGDAEVVVGDGEAGGGPARVVLPAPLVVLDGHLGGVAQVQAVEAAATGSGRGGSNATLARDERAGEHEPGSLVARPSER